MAEEQIQEQDKPLVDPSNASEPSPEDVKEDPIPLHEDSEEKSEITTDTSDDEPIPRPDYYPEKFWDDDGPDVEKMAKAYGELEKKFKNGDHKAPKEYDISKLKEEGLAEDDQSLSIYKEWAKENGISQSAFEDLASKIYSISQTQEAVQRQDYETEMNKLGENAKEKIAMAERLLYKAPMNDEEKEALSASLNNATSINAFLKYHQSITNENIPMKPAVENQGMNKDDLETAIADPRWLSDPVWRSQQEKKWFKSQQ